jgi:hypothetical protein
MCTSRTRFVPPLNQRICAETVIGQVNELKKVNVIYTAFKDYRRDPQDSVSGIAVPSCGTWLVLGDSGAFI